MSLLVLAAWEPELERFRALKNAAVDLNMDAVGIGPVDAALGTARSLAKHRPTTVLLLGTAGAHEGCGETVGNVIVAHEVRLIDPATLESRAAMPYASDAITLDRDLVEACIKTGAAAPHAVANTLGITTDDALAKTLARVAPIEHLEAYAVARACELFGGIRCAILLGISNMVGARGREEWRLNHVNVSARAADAALKILPALLSA